jgi:ATP-binding cassette subfamily F protein uup
MSIITLENISRGFSDKPLFEEVTFGLEEGERVALIGANGTGKTTLLRMIAGEMEPDSGRVYRSGEPIVGYLPQNPPFDPEATVLDTIFAASTDTMKLLHDYEEVCHQLAKADGDTDALINRMTELSARMDATNAWSHETDAKIILDKLGILDTDAKMGELSGGQRKRVAMAHALIEHPDLLILDEPTNHLDADTITWLEEFLVRYNGALLLVTHDRYFLERVTHRIIEIDRGRVQSYAGNFSYYLEKKEEEEERREVEGHKRDMLVRQELAWLRSGAKARRTKQKARIERATDLMSAPREGKKEEIDIAVGAQRLGKKILELHDVSKAYGEKVLVTDFTHVMIPNERVGVIGPNGAGKTTLLEMIVGTVTPDGGRIETGSTVAIGYYDQESRALADDLRVIDYIKEVAEYVKTSDGSVITASQMLDRFLFPPTMQYAVIGNLSGGERRRLYLLRILMSAPNVLILDEPTNDLDIATLAALESYLDDFPGAVIIVSHDRYFLDRTAEHIFRFEGDGVIRDYPGNYSAFLEIKEREEAEATQAPKSAPPPVTATPAPRPVEKEARKLSFKEKKELETLEKEIETSEAKIAELEEQLVTADFILAPQIGEELKTLNQKLERDVERWGELAGKAS